jgi:hypothetical protein
MKEKILVGDFGLSRKESLSRLEYDDPLIEMGNVEFAD